MTTTSQSNVAQRESNIAQRESNESHGVGIDVAKDEFVVHVLPTNNSPSPIL